MTDGAADGLRPGRMPALDLIRGVAVLGILAVNVAGFAGPPAGLYSPDMPSPGSPADHAVFAVVLVVFEGKMRALFSILFGASLLLFVERAEGRGRDGQLLQIRRLGWLAAFGYAHFLFLWWGDILFLYAVAGFAALALRGLPMPAAIAAALLTFTAWQAEGVVRQWPLAEAEAASAAGIASPEQRRLLAGTQASRAESAAEDTRTLHAGFVSRLRAQLDDVFYPFDVMLSAMGETLAYMLAGMLLLRSGFFSGAWSKARLRWLAFGGLATGGAATLAFTLWAWRHGFPEEAMRLAINHGLGYPHLLMALAYLALLMLGAPLLLATRLGQRLRAAGRAALTNYLGTSLVMGAIFAGWGLDLAGRFGDAGLMPFTLLGWLLMLAWSEPWLARFRLGPVEWLWRRLAEGREKFP